MDEKAVRKNLPELIFFTDKPGRSNVVCFTDMASIVLSEQWHKDRKENFNDDKSENVNAAVNSIKNEIRCIRYETNVYSSKADTEFVPNICPLL